MCKIVYLTCKRFNSEAKTFRNDLAEELRRRNVEVVTGNSTDIFNFQRRHKTYGIAIAFDFYEEGKGSGLTLNRNCSNIGRNFAYSLFNRIDSLLPAIVWRNFEFVDSEDREWKLYFEKISSTVRAIFYLCTKTDPTEWNLYSTVYGDLIKAFADEIVRCLRSDYDSENYRKRVMSAKLKLRKN